MITEQRLTQALKYLAETDEPAAKAKAYMLGLGGQEKTILATQFIGAEGTVAFREATAMTSKEYADWASQYKGSVYDFEILRNKRSTEALIVEVWRSLNANQRRGNV
jgi:hypothetical protein